MNAEVSNAAGGRGSCLLIGVLVTDGEAIPNSMRGHSSIVKKILTTTCLHLQHSHHSHPPLFNRMSSGEYERDSSRRSPLDVFAGLFIILAGSLIFPSPALAFVPPSIIAPYSTYPPVTLLKKHPLRTTLWNSPGDDEAESGQDNMSVGEAEETILRVSSLDW